MFRNFAISIIHALREQGFQAYLVADVCAIFS